MVDAFTGCLWLQFLVWLHSVSSRETASCRCTGQHSSHLKKITYQIKIQASCLDLQAFKSCDKGSFNIARCRRAAGKSGFVVASTCKHVAFHLAGRRQRNHKDSCHHISAVYLVVLTSTKAEEAFLYSNSVVTIDLCTLLLQYHVQCSLDELPVRIVLNSRPGIYVRPSICTYGNAWRIA